MNFLSKTKNKILSQIKSIFRLTRFTFYVLIRKEVFFSIQKKIPRQFIGSQKYGGWFISPKNINENSVVYSFGIGEDISFDLDLLSKYRCKIFAFDPTPKSISWIKNQSLPKNFRYFEYGLSTKNGMINLFPPKDPGHVSHSIISKDKSSAPIKADVKNLATIMKELNHNKIDILKMDIEGSEYEVIDDIIKNNPDIVQILLEFHHRFPGISTQKTKNAIKKLNNAGYKIFAISPSREEYSLIKTK